MKTDELITLLARDAPPIRRGMLPMHLALAALAGGLVAFVVLAPWLGIRTDLAEAVTGMTFWMKALYTFGLGVAGFALAERLSRPGAKGRAGWVLVGFLALVTTAIAVNQLMVTPPEQMREAFLGSTWDTCPWRILALALPGLAVSLWSLRRAAPTRPILAGAAAGLLAGGVAATVYGLHCEEIAAPFVALWYSLGVILSVIAGAIVGSRVLRW